MLGKPNLGIAFTDNLSICQILANAFEGLPRVYVSRLDYAAGNQFRPPIFKIGNRQWTHRGLLRVAISGSAAIRATKPLKTYGCLCEICLYCFSLTSLMRGLT